MAQNLRIKNLEIPADLPDLGELEKAALIRAVEERYTDVETQTRGKVVDTARLSLLTAVSFAYELQRLEDQVKAQRSKDESKLEESITHLESVLKK